MTGYFDLPNVSRFVMNDKWEWEAEQVQDSEKAGVVIATLEAMFSGSFREVGDSHLMPGVPDLVRAAEFFKVEPVVLVKHRKEPPGVVN